MSSFDLGAYQLDVLREVGNIGAGHAATALSKLLHKQVEMRIPQVNVLFFSDVADMVGGAEQVVVAIYLRVEGEAPGNMFFMLSMKSAKQILRNFAGIEVNSDDEFSEMELSALAEIGNILVGSYVTSLADFTNLRLYPTIPGIAIDMAGAILSSGLYHYSEMGERAVLIETRFIEGKDEDEVDGHFFLIPDPDSFKQIFTALGVPFE